MLIRFFVSLLMAAVRLEAAGIEVVLPEQLRVVSAEATTRELKSTSVGVIKANIVVFENLLPDTPYDLSITTSQGRVLQGVDMGWYSPWERSSDQVGSLTDEDQIQIKKIITEVPAFYSRSELLVLQGDAERAVALVQLIRDRPFHGSGREEVIWRVELWYFQNHAGGWQKVQQQHRVLRRERFSTRQAYQAEVDRLVWMPCLGGITIPEGQALKRVELTTWEQPTVCTGTGEQM